MSYIYDPRTGLSQRMSDMCFGIQPHDSSHVVYGGTHRSDQEHEVLHQQNVELRDSSGYIYGPRSPSCIRSHRVSGLQNSDSSRRFPARAASLPGLSELGDSRHDSNAQDRHNGFPDVAADHRHSRRDSHAQNPDHGDLRSREDRLAKRYAEIGPAAYLESIVARDSLRFGLSVPRFSPVFTAELAPADEAYPKPTIARDGLSVPHLRPVFPAGPSRADEALLADRVGALGPAAYMKRTASQDELHPLSWHPLPEKPEPSLEEVNRSQDSSSRQLIHALDEYYRRELREDPGHRFDDVDDTVIAAYINACEHAYDPGQRMQRIVGRDQPFAFFNRWIVPIPFLNLQLSALEVALPVDVEAITELNNDILRVLYVHFSNDSRTIPSAVARAGMEDNRRRILSELARRGLTSKLPHAVRIRGLKDRSVPRGSRDPGWLHDSVSGSSMPVGQTSREEGNVRTPKGSRDNKARQDVRRGSTSTTEHSFGEVSKKKKGKTPVTRVYEIDSSDHSSATASPNTVQYELEVSSSEDGTRPIKGKAPIVEATLEEISCDSPEETKHKAEGLLRGTGEVLQSRSLITKGSSHPQDSDDGFGAYGYMRIWQ